MKECIYAMFFSRRDGCEWRVIDPQGHPVLSDNSKDLEDYCIHYNHLVDAKGGYFFYEEYIRRRKFELMKNKLARKIRKLEKIIQELKKESGHHDEKET